MLQQQNEMLPIGDVLVWVCGVGVDGRPVPVPVDDHHELQRGGIIILGTAARREEDCQDQAEAGKVHHHGGNGQEGRVWTQVRKLPQV